MRTDLEEIVRIEGGAVLATLIRLTGDFDAAEDAVQDAALAALQTWADSGVPDNPGAWLTTVAKRKALDRIRREASRADRETEATLLVSSTAASERGGTEDARPDSVVKDDLLRLIFTCCHPALSFPAQTALTLRTVCRLPTEDIAALHLVPHATIAQRITRAKRKIAVARIPYRVPRDHELTDRLAAVLAVVHALFTAGHHAPSGSSVVRHDIAAEAIRLARLLARLLPDEPETAGLLALLLATHARQAARVDGNGELILLADQDRRRWDHDAIREADGVLQDALARRRPGRYQIQAAIACLHGLAPSAEATDWPQTAELYRALEEHEPTAVVRVNRAVAEAEARGPAAGLHLLEGVEGVERWHLYWATKADFLRRLHRLAEAAASYRQALACECNDADRRFLERRLHEVQQQ